MVLETLDTRFESQLTPEHQSLVTRVLVEQILDGVFSAELVETALSHSQHDVDAKTDIRTLDVQDGFRVWELKHLLEWLDHLELATTVLEGSMEDLAVSCSNEDFEEGVFLWIVVYINRPEGPRLESITHGHASLSDHAVQEDLVNLDDGGVVPIVVEKLMLSYHDAVGALPRHKHFPDVFSFKLDVINWLWLDFLV